MESTLAVAVLTLVALLAANLPFLTRRIFFVVPPRWRDKGFGWRLAEVLALYLVVGALARLLEARTGAVYRQGWALYVMTLALFIVAAYPGFF